MKTVNDKLKADVGVIVGRFQVPQLHDAHRDLIQTVVDNHERVILFLGLSPLKATLNNPLDYKARKQMIESEFPDIDVLFIKDTPSDDYWSVSLDQQIADIVGPNQTVTLYGSRDSFVSHYTGRYQTQELESDVIISGTEIRKQVSRVSKNSKEFRSGVIWATTNQWPCVVPTVDIAIIDKDGRTWKILLAKKEGENKYRFVGGFADPTKQHDNDGQFTGLERDAMREVMEETGLSVSEMNYVGSFFIDDWRFRDEKNKIVTTFYVTYKTHGRAEASDDIAEVKWFGVNELNEQLFVSEHVVLFKKLLTYLKDIK